MSETVLQIENIGKKYRYGKIGSGSLRQDLNRWWQSSVLRREGAFFKHASEAEGDSTTPGEFWALQNISFDIKDGEVWGIVGENGAGKSTLLKILSRVTKPSTGSIKGKGKISSLLEVGIGFQPELTGRENIYTSGHILGMKKAEINDRLDEIIEFAGVGEFLDTPVKRYSSGMYMRLAFSVAAHLDPDILIVDEVLAVGDYEFQKKCLNKMHEVSSAKGRTVIFVSHNLQAVANLCKKAVWLQKGRIKRIGEAAEVIGKYTASFQTHAAGEEWDNKELAPGNEHIKLKSIEVKSPGMPEAYLKVSSRVALSVEFWNEIDHGKLNVNFKLFTNAGELVFAVGSPLRDAMKGIYVLEHVIPANLLNNNKYVVALSFMRNVNDLICEFPRAVAFDVEDERSGVDYFGAWPGIIRPQLETHFFLKQPVEGVYA
jgi:lipopolysaccharide transport system ATP-binding protein